MPVYFVYFHEMVEVDPANPPPNTPAIARIPFYNLANQDPVGTLPLAKQLAMPRLLELLQDKTNFTVVQRLPDPEESD